MKLEIIMDMEAFEDSGARSFASAIKKKLNKMGLGYSVLAHPSFNNPYILLSPTSLPDKYKNHDLQLDKNTTVKVVKNLLYMSGCKNVVIFGFGDTVGKPLAESIGRIGISHNLVRSDTAQSEIDEYLSQCDGVVLCAPFGMKIEQNYSDKVLIDVGNNFDGEYPKLMFNYREIGKQTVNEICRDYENILKESLS